MLGIGQQFPQYNLTGVVSNDAAKAFQPFNQDSHKGKWRVVFFWPKDFTFVCPTEIAAFGKIDKEFKAGLLRGKKTPSKQEIIADMFPGHILTGHIDVNTGAPIAGNGLN